MTITPEQLAVRMADAERLVSTLADLLEDREWEWSDDSGRSVTSCRDFGASFFKMEPMTHKPECKLDVALKAARAMGDR